MKKSIPNFITCLNLTAGTIGIYYTLVEGEPRAIYFVLIGAFFDFLDGLVARLLQVSSELGKQLDSLADLITFGLLPSFYILVLLRAQSPLFWIAVLIAIFSAIRLGRFNIDETQKDSFLGLPTPANAIMLTSIAFVPFQLSANAIIGITLLSCLLLVSNIRLIALKFANFGWKGNEFRWVFLGSIVVLTIVFKWTVVPLLVPFYVVVSLLSSVKKTETS